MRYALVLIGVLSACLAALLVWVLGEAPRPLDGRVMQAIVAGSFIGLGWSVAFLTQEYRRWKERDDLRREVQTALRAEISDFAAKVDYARLGDDHAAEMTEKIEAGGDHWASSFQVFVPRRNDRAIFDMLGDSVRHVGPEATDSVIWFYSQVIDLETLAADMGSERFNRLPAARRAQLYRHYIQMMLEAKARAETAKYWLSRGIDGQPNDETEEEDWTDPQAARAARIAGKRAELRALSSRAAGPDGP